MEEKRSFKEYFKISELSEYSGISQRTLRSLLNDPMNPIPYFRIGAAGRIIRIKRSDFDDWAESQKAEHKNGIDDLIAEILQ